MNQPIVLHFLFFILENPIEKWFENQDRKEFSQNTLLIWIEKRAQREWKLNIVIPYETI